MYYLVRSQRATAHTLQNVSDVNRECSRPAAASSICDSTRHIFFISAQRACVSVVSISEFCLDYKLGKILVVVEL